MFFALNDSQREWRGLCHDFAVEVMRPAALGYDRDQEVPWAVLRAARARGLHGLEAIERMAKDPEGISAAIYAEEMHWGCAGIALAMSASWLAATAIASAGTREQVARWLPECFGVDGEVKLAALAVTEPAAGSDVHSLRTSARRHRDGWILDGNKVLISNAGVADVNVVVATVDPGLGHGGQAAFVVRRGTPGLSFGAKVGKLGVRASPTAEISLQDCHVPEEHLLGGPDRLARKMERARQGLPTATSDALATFEETRPLVAAGAVGVMRAAYEWTIDHLTHSPAGIAVLREDRAQHLLADVATEIDAARLLAWRAARMSRRGLPMRGGEGSMSKLKAADSAVWATTSLMDLLGPEAAHVDNPMQKFFRDAKVFQIFEGTAQIQRRVIAGQQLTGALRRQREAKARTSREGAGEDAGARG
ncbi:MAG TPA: acyl-CoA dehydrogenase family protein [Solirubrobacterales bacterium]|nr:acyl-CoA dehydrogenase family protein [Solirubrobacterales bacterium]